VTTPELQQDTQQTPGTQPGNAAAAKKDSLEVPSPQENEVAD